MKKLNFTQILSIFLVCVLSVFFLSSIASAHVVVYPKETSQGAYEKFSVRVPNEKNIPTVKIEVKFPADVNISRFEPKPGWIYELTKDDSDLITSVIWTAEGEGLSSTEFADFNMQGKVGDEATALVWKAYQTYEDGTVVEWIGAEDDHPASETIVKESTDEAGHHGAGDGMGGDTDESEVSIAAQLPLYLSAAALILGILSMIMALRKKAIR